MTAAEGLDWGELAEAFGSNVPRAGWLARASGAGAGLEAAAR